jgi:dihydrofolate synthase/folylpolyglutamate synthase
LDYNDATAYLDSFVNFERRPPDAAMRDAMSLERVRELLAELGSPHARLRCLHVAGTKGKGSTAAMAESALRAAGYRTGLYTSPHLVDLRERIRVDGRPIPPDDFAALVERTRPGLERIQAKADATPPGEYYRPPTYFEVMTHLAFLCFEEANVDVAVLEVGMGGRLDATNVVTPAACAITSVSIDHTAILGSTLAAIAREKAGILKSGVPCVVAPQPEEAAASIRSVAEEVGVPLWLVGEDVTLERAGGGAFDVRTPGRTYENLTIPLQGAHQRENAAVAVGLVDLGRRAGFGRVTPDAVREGLARVSWPGRVQRVAEAPATFLDGAHNPASVRVLVRALAELLPPGRRVYVLAVANDKDWRGMIEVLAPSAGAIVATTSGNPRAVAPADLAECARAAGVERVEVEEDAPRALDLARRIAGTDGSVVATGSLYLVGLLLQYLRIEVA